MFASMHPGKQVKANAFSYPDEARKECYLQLDSGDDYFTLHNQTPESLIDLGERIKALGESLRAEPVDALDPTGVIKRQAEIASAIA